MHLKLFIDLQLLFFALIELPRDLRKKKTIRGGGGIVLNTIYTVYTVNTDFTVHTIYNALHCMISSMHVYVYC